MKIVILGAGALGTVLGAHLARAGEDVTLIARGQRAAYLQEHGASITGLVDFTVPVRVITDPQQVHNADVLMVTVKTYDMASALASVKHLDVSSVLSIQNGVLKDEQLAQTFGWEKVLGAMVFTGAEVLPSGIVAHVTPSIQSLEWSKYVSWVCGMAPAVLTRLETYKLLQDVQIATIVAAILQEMTQLATARAIVLEDITFFPTKTLSELSVDAMVTQLRPLGDRWASLMPHNKISALQDVERGKRLEVEETLGYAVRQSAALGIPTPTMDTCYRLIAGINHYLQ